MGITFDKFYAELESEAKSESAESLAAFKTLERHFAAVSHQIGVLRKQRGLTQQQLAEQSDVPQAEISRIEKGKANPTLKTLTSIGKALGAPLLFDMSAITPAKRKSTTQRRRVAAATKTARAKR